MFCHQGFLGVFKKIHCRFPSISRKFLAFLAERFVTFQHCRNSTRRRITTFYLREITICMPHHVRHHPLNKRSRSAVQLRRETHQRKKTEQKHGPRISSNVRAVDDAELKSSKLISNTRDVFWLLLLEIALNFQQFTTGSAKLTHRMK